MARRPAGVTRRDLGDDFGPAGVTRRCLGHDLSLSLSSLPPSFDGVYVRGVN